MRWLAVVTFLWTAAALGQAVQPTVITKPGQPGKRVTTTTVGGSEALDVNVASSTASADGKILDGTGAGQADVVNAAPTTEYGLVTRNIPSGTQGVSGTFWPTTSAAPSSCRMSDGASFYDNAKTGQLPTALDGSGFLKVHEQGTALVGDGSGPLTVDGTVSANATLAAETTKVIGTINVAASQTIAATQATAANLNATVAQGANTWTVQPGNTANTTPWLFDLKNIAGSAIVTAATGIIKAGIVGNAGAAFDAANNASVPANAIAVGLEVVASGANPTAATGGNLRRQLASTEGVAFVQEGNGNRFSCFVQAVTATTQCQAAPGAGLKAYVTSVHMSNQAATVQTLDLVYGTGSNCGTGTGGLTHKWQMGTNATTTSPQSIDASFDTPLVPGAANAICVRPANATAFGATITGYIAP
jgi:hypothetical protein